jgi:cell division protease FtsH
MFGKPHEEVFLGMEMSQRTEYSEQTAQSIDKEIGRILSESYDRAKEILKGNLAILHSMADALLEREVLDSKDIDDIIHSHGGNIPSGASA